MPDSAHHEDWHPRHGPWLIAVGVMLATFMQVLDTSIANIALPHIAGSLSATTDEATWVLTSYLVSNAIILPMTGWLGNHFGRKRVFISCIGIFTFASVLCGLALNLPMLILARILQGAGGGAMVPIAQAILLESFPVAKRGVAMATFSLAVIVAPIIGPTLGGWITDNYSWRWIFYINLPVGILAVFLANWLVEDPPYIKRNEKAAIDFIGFGLLALWLATLQIVLDKGQEVDWLGAVWIRWFIMISACSMIGFIVWEFKVEHPLVDLRILKSRNFAVGLMLMTVVGVILYGTTAELPLFLQTLMGYPALQSGYAMSPRGIAAFITTFIVGRLVGKIRLRWLLCFGFSMLALSAFLLSDLTLQVSMAQRHFSDGAERRGHQFHFRAVDDGDDEPVAPAANRQRHRPLQSHAQHRRQHRHRHRHHPHCARRAGASGAYGRASDADRPGVHAATARSAGRARPARRPRDGHAPGLRPHL